MPDAPVTHPVQVSFARGEVSPFLFGRTDLTGWSQGLRTLRNMFVRPEGAVSNRPGFGYVGNSVTVTAKGSILVPFIFSATQSYVLEMGGGIAQVFSQGAQVPGGTSTNISAISFAIVGGVTLCLVQTASPHGMVAGQNFTVGGVVGTGFAAVNGTWAVASVLDPTHFYIKTGKGSAGAYTSGGTVTPISSFAIPWANADLPLLRWSQSADTLTLVHPNYQTREIKRTSATLFTPALAVYNNGPFLPQNTDGTTLVYATGITGNVQLVSSAAIFNPNHVGSLFYLQQQDLSPIPPWEANKVLTLTGATPGPIGLYCRSNLKNYKCVAAAIGGPNAISTGQIAPSHSQGTAFDGSGTTISGFADHAGVGWQFQDFGFGVVQITGYVSPTVVNATVMPVVPGQTALLPLTVVGQRTLVAGPFGFTGDGVTTSFGPMGGVTSINPNQFYVTVSGAYVSPSGYSITPGGNIIFSAAPANTAPIVVNQVNGLYATTFWAFGAFSADQGYPSAVTYFPDRLILAATPKQPVGVFGSKTSQYHEFGVSNPVVASDAFSVFLNARQLNSISDLVPLSDLLVGTSNIIWRLWPGSTGTALSPLAIAANPQSYYGECPTCAAVLFGDSAVFAEYDGRRLRDLIYQFAYDKFLGQELTLYSRHLIPFGTTFQRLAYKPDSAAQFVFGLRSDGVLLCCTYLRDQQVIGWAHWDVQGAIEDICVVPENGAYALYVIVNRTIAGVQTRSVERLANREVLTIFDYQFLDSCLTYDGRNKSAVTMQLTGGTTYMAGDTGTLTASAATGWATFLSSDPNNKNEIWIFQTFNFTSSVGAQKSGVLTTPTVPGSYVVTFSDGETQTMTVGADGVSCTWQISLNNASILSATYRCRLLITAMVSPTVASVRLRDPCPDGLQGFPTSVWTFARTTFGGISQLAGAAVAAYADGASLGIQNSAIAPDGSIMVGNDGSVTLPRAGGVVQVGLPYLADFETLALNEQGQETIRMRAKTNPVIYLDCYETRNFLAGTDFSTVEPNAERNFEPYVSPTSLQFGVQWARIQSTLDSECHSCIRQNMPLPITIRAHIPQVTLGSPIS